MPAPAVPVPDTRVVTGDRRHLSESLEALVWVGPAFLYLAFFIAYPFLMSIYLSLSSARVASPEYHFTGLQNYTRLFADPVFWQTVQNSFVFTFGSEIIRLVIGLPLAFALNRPFKGKRLVQGLILIPFVIPIALSSLAWKWMFDSLYSVINWMLITAGIIEYPWQWLGEPGLAMWSVIILNVWRGFPFSAIILLAGLTAVPVEVIEAAKIDGAGPLRFFRHILLPLSRTNVAALFVILFLYGWNQYLWPLLITTSSGMNTIVIGITKMIGTGDAQTDWNLIMSTAMLAMLPPVAVILLMQRWFVKGLVETEK
jgi:multiple sugar transport system permease protein